MVRARDGEFVVGRFVVGLVGTTTWAPLRFGGFEYDI
jgi:hypothetical protein